MKKYEVMFIVKPTLEEDTINQVAENMKKVLTDKKATIIDAKPMGQKELAYEIKGFKSGYYFLFTVESENADAVKEFDRVARIDENVIRHLILNLDK